MLEFELFDLADDAAAGSFIKEEVVEVQFAVSAGVLQSREGPNRYEPGDALVTSSTGDRWSVSRQRFDLKYQVVEASPDPAGSEAPASHHFRNRPWPILAKCIDQPFAALRSAGGDRLRGSAGDWLVQYAPGDFGVVEKTRFAQVYRPYGTSAARSSRFVAQTESHSHSDQHNPNGANGPAGAAVPTGVDP